MGRQYIRHAVGRGYLDLPVLTRPVSYHELRRVRFDPSIPEFDELLTRYYSHRLFRKDLLLGDSIQANQRLQLLHWGLIHMYSAALAANAGAWEVEFEHLIEAVRTVEKYYVFHSTLDRLFTRYPLLRGFLDRI